MFKRETKIRDCIHLNVVTGSNRAAPSNDKIIKTLFFNLTETYSQII